MKEDNHNIRTCLGGVRTGPFQRYVSYYLDNIRGAMHYKNQAIDGIIHIFKLSVNPTCHCKLPTFQLGKRYGHHVTLGPDGGDNEEMKMKTKMTILLNLFFSFYSWFVLVCLRHVTKWYYVCFLVATKVFCFVRRVIKLSRKSHEA